MAATGKELRRGRHYLGKASAVALRQRVYRTRECLEVDEIDGYDVVRKRVFFDEVLLVTYHRFLGLPFVVAMSVFSVLFGLTALAIGVRDVAAGLWFALFLMAPFLIALVLRLALKVDAVTVYGKRSKAQVHFPFRKARAREVYVQICRAVREHQERLLRELARAQARRVPLAPPAPPA
jgi:hypothetical protein